MILLLATSSYLGKHNKLAFLPLLCCLSLASKFTVIASSIYFGGDSAEPRDCLIISLASGARRTAARVSSDRGSR